MNSAVEKFNAVRFQLDMSMPESTSISEDLANSLEKNTGTAEIGQPLAGSHSTPDSFRGIWNEFFNGSGEENKPITSLLFGSQPIEECLVVELERNGNMVKCAVHAPPNAGQGLHEFAQRVKKAGAQCEEFFSNKVNNALYGEKDKGTPDVSKSNETTLQMDAEGKNKSFLNDIKNEIAEFLGLEPEDEGIEADKELDIDGITVECKMVNGQLHIHITTPAEAYDGPEQDGPASKIDQLVDMLIGKGFQETQKDGLEGSKRVEAGGIAELLSQVFGQEGVSSDQLAQCGNNFPPGVAEEAAVIGETMINAGVEPDTGFAPKAPAAMSADMQNQLKDLDGQSVA